MGIISGRRAKEHVVALVEPQERIAGSAAEREGAEKVRDLLAPFMDHCTLEGYPVNVYERGEGQLEVVSPEQCVIRPAMVNAISGAGSGVGRLIDVGDGTAAGYLGIDGDVQGCVALATLTDLADLARLGPIATEAHARGVACLLYHFRDRPHPSIHVGDVDIPTLTISNDSAAYLRSLLVQHTEVTVRYASGITEADGLSYNVVGAIRGSVWPNQIIYVTSHLDTYFQGANDNNSSTAVLLELAAVLQQQRPKRTFMFVVFGGEEGGTLRGSESIYHDRGSLAFTEEYRVVLEGQSRELPVAVINGEILGFNTDPAIHGTPEFERFLWQAVADLSTNRRVLDTGGFWTGSDHLCFHTLGVPSLFLMPDMEPGTGEKYWELYHTPLDNLDTVFPEALEANARLFTLLALRLDEAEMPPYALGDLVALARRNLEVLPNAEAISAVLGEHLARIERLPAGEPALREQLALIRVIFTNAYSFASIAGGLRLMCDYFTQSLTGLREAYYLATVDGDLNRARARLLNTPDGRFTASYSSAVIDDEIARRGRTAFYARFHAPYLDLREALRLVADPQQVDAFARELRNQIDHLTRMAAEAGARYERDLRALQPASE
ncbi:MAG: hypothetical protein DCC58_01385 [Chloroflexi bacterium]|nr:MAG: hypothetical protein DCC58_01385 [Chloroflexota bacterium]